MRLYLCFWLAGIYTYNTAIQQQPDPKVPPRDDPPTPSVLVHHGLRQGGRTFLPPPSQHLWRGIPVRARRESRAKRSTCIDGPPRVITAACCAVRPLSGDGRLRLGYDKSNGNGVAQQKSVGSM